MSPHSALTGNLIGTVLGIERISKGLPDYSVLKLPYEERAVGMFKLNRG